MINDRDFICFIPFHASIIHNWDWNLKGLDSISICTWKDGPKIKYSMRVTIKLVNCAFTVNNTCNSLFELLIYFPVLRKLNRSLQSFIKYFCHVLSLSGW